MTTPTIDSVAGATAVPALYRVSALFYGFLRMWRGWKVVLPLLLANALIQACLTLIPVGAGFSAVFLVTVFVSAVLFIVVGAVLTAACLEVAMGSVQVEQIGARLQSNLGRFSIAIVALAIVVLVGLSFYTWPGLLLAALAPFVTLAAMDGAGNPLKANFKVIAARPVRWFFTMLVMGVIALIVWVLMAVNGFFVPSWVGSFAACFAGGLLLWWWQSTLALIYRSVR